ncbi:hypothetical protein ACQCSX_09730 [Pseudarthrobacter sp. P1]|uniref:hypothetical protein n=1 Tax=Pseudarthrobacter sp. P1 TaxID=3418418 RepID=UPI003CEDD1C9
MTEDLGTRVDADATPAPATINHRLYTALGRGLAPLRRLPWWAQVSLVYFAARLVSYLIFVSVALHQGASPWGPASPDYLHFVGIWDSEWYQRIFADGYPAQIPRDAAGVAGQNQWAFYPLFPLLVMGLSAVTGLGWLVLAPTVALLCGLAATLAIYKLFRHFAAGTTALWGVVFFATFPISPILQVPYAESLNTALIAAALYQLVRRRYLWAIPVVVLMCLSRPAGVPFAALVAAHIGLRLWHRRRDGFARVEMLASGALLLASGVAAFAWPLIAWAVTGEMKAYTDTEMAWRGTDLTLFKPWFDAGVSLLGPVAGPLAPLLLVALAALYLNSEAVRRIGTDLRLWCAAYLGYLLAVLHPQTSTFRMLLPLFPLALAAAFLSRSKAYRGTVVVLFVLLQIVWVTWLWSWAQLPGGGDYPP